jgi:type I restriction enzyme M protein
LTGAETYGGLFTDTPSLYDIVLTNPPFGGKEGKEAQTRFAYKTGATQVLFLQHVIDSLKPGGKCGIILDEGVLFRTNETAFVQTKRKLLDDCDVWCILSLPSGTFVNAGAGVKTNVVFFTKGQATEKIWYYDLSGIKVGKKSPLTRSHFDDFFHTLHGRGDSACSWMVDFTERKRKAAEQSEPFKRQARAKAQEASQTRERLIALKKVTPVDTAAIVELEVHLAQLTGEVRDLTARAQAIDDAVYDLKAVNPHAKNDEDTRTPEELLELIERKGEEVREAVALLRAVGRARFDLHLTTGQD